ncbi:LysR family transcriptional regulator [Aureimonas endophytica]|uniref:LysR family transcriptional regulator n=1 Tax=Aureimonas endophytica TaxID=2027858 RepID=A0A916ZPX0_9HYPH|nr:LysR substrate-binding domain-containing protein [Aureimonas endophytica]GGE08172.1 LysR family transcriptional regulator [Aureimonas endophytica]
MKRGRLPLTALRSFEAAGRLQSFTLAADELAVSQAAVSRQIRDLETDLGRRLFDRRHRHVELTAEGAELLGVLTESFAAIEARLAGLAARPSRGEARLSCEPSFAACWLVPRLAQFREQHPEIDPVIDSDARLIAFRRSEPELAVRSGVVARSWPGLDVRPLMETRMVAVAAPELLARIGPPRQPAELLAEVLLHEESRDGWRRWFEAAGLAHVEAIRGPVYADGGLLLQAVLRGQGIALLDIAFARPEIAAGRLVQLFATDIPWGGYFLVARDFRRLSEPARIFAAWIEAAMTRENGAAPG